MACWTSTDVEVIYSLSISRDNEDCGNINATPDKELTTNLEMYWSGSSSRQLSHLARALANFRLIFSPSLKDTVPIFHINFYRISL
jgi:hypothetical protein